ncbi:cupin domain-containing protein [Ralstonia solanacearum]|uniref:cupin domain-containing protein n=1 Tax=Ralstonia solanacearum TaxID=305 RepID=UPI001FF7FCE1|nr:cupin domain-containing protein [Ralstonia solanacearum]MDB0567476.1 cupin domain-containing protein [Ralstonia solanacearum]MDB0577296.1 cupin domain-containing protein [Ralstonia solanacearum]
MHRKRDLGRLRAVCAVVASTTCLGVWAQMPASAPTASAPPLTPQIIDMGAMTATDIGPVMPDMGTLRAKGLVATASGTVGIQVGTVVKHTHTYSDEIQYVMSGTATVWLDNGPREVHAGDLIVIPRGTVHGTLVTSTDFKAMAIKLPPQRAGDTQKVP